MKKGIKIIFKMLITILVVMTMTGCWDARELYNISMVVGLGIDKGEADDTVLLTAQIVKPQKLKSSFDASTSSQSKAYWNLQSTGDTVFDAVREFTHKTSQKLYISHSDVIILGKEVASDDVQKYLDFFTRSNETRPNTHILVANGTAAEILDVQPELDNLPAINISKLIDAQGLTSYSKAVDFEEFTNRLLSSTTSPVAPIISVEDNNNEKVLSINGLAVFKQNKMVGELNSMQTRGFLWVIGEVETGVIVIPYKDGKVSIEIKKATSKVKPKFVEDKILMQIEIQFAGVLVGQTVTENLATVPAFEELIKLINIAIEGEILDSLKKAQELNADIFGFGETIHKKDRKKWKELEPNWDSIFSSIQLDLEIESKLIGTGHATKPAMPESLQIEGE